jgi:pSer/pThr/pTyr-binding forkhead associated (FHA) protein
MAKIVVRHQNQTLAEFGLHRGVNSIGRLPTHTVCIENLGISRNHAFILGDIDEKVFVLEDLKSLNGTYVNKKRVHKYLLNHGDVITIGQHALEFRDEPLQTRTTPPPAENAGSTSAPDESDAASLMQFMSGPRLENLEDGKQMPLLKETLFFGNSSADDVHIPGLMVGKNFASLNRRGSVWVANLLVKRFSHLRLNGEDIVSSKLKDNDVLDVAGIRFRFHESAKG